MRKIYSTSNLSAIKSEAYFNALIAKETQTCHKYKVKHTEYHTGITRGCCRDMGPQMTTL